MSVLAFTRESWLEEAKDLLLFDIFTPALGQLPLSKIKVSVGFGAGKAAQLKVLGCCYPSSASSEGFSEIFISPTCDDSLVILSTLAHELIHAIDDCKSGHKGFFTKTARKIGLIGPLTATRAGVELAKRLDSIVKLLGPIPHSKLNLSGQKKQANRNILVVCGCGFRFRTAQSQIDNILENRAAIACPNCFSSMTVEL